MYVCICIYLYICIYAHITLRWISLRCGRSHFGTLLQIPGYMQDSKMSNVWPRAFPEGVLQQVVQPLLSGVRKVLLALLLLLCVLLYGCFNLLPLLVIEAGGNVAGRKKWPGTFNCGFDSGQFRAHKKPTRAKPHTTLPKKTQTPRATQTTHRNPSSTCSMARIQHVPSEGAPTSLISPQERIHKRRLA